MEAQKEPVCVWGCRRQTVISLAYAACETPAREIQANLQPESIAEQATIHFRDMLVAARGAGGETYGVH